MEKIAKCPFGEFHYNQLRKYSTEKKKYCFDRELYWIQIIDNPRDQWFIRPIYSEDELISFDMAHFNEWDKEDRYYKCRWRDLNIIHLKGVGIFIYSSVVCCELHDNTRVKGDYTWTVNNMDLSVAKTLLGTKTILLGVQTRDTITKASHGYAYFDTVRVKSERESIIPREYLPIRPIPYTNMLHKIYD